MIAEVKRLNDLLAEANKRAISQYALIDKLTAANLHVQALLRKLGVLRPAPSDDEDERLRSVIDARGDLSA